MPIPPSHRAASGNRSIAHGTSLPWPLPPLLVAPAPAAPREGWRRWGATAARTRRDTAIEDGQVSAWVAISVVFWQAGGAHCRTAILALLPDPGTCNKAQEARARRRGVCGEARWAEADGGDGRQDTEPARNELRFLDPSKVLLLHKTCLEAVEVGAALCPVYTPAGQ